MLRVSYRLPLGRRRAGGRHAAPRLRPGFLPSPSVSRSASRLPLRAARGAIALALVLSTGAVVAAAEPGTPSLAVDPSDIPTIAQAAASRAADVTVAHHRTQAVAAARGAAEAASDLRAEAVEAAVSDHVLAELDAATQELNGAMQEVQSTSLVIERTEATYRSIDRSDVAETEEAAQPAEPAAPAGATDPAGEAVVVAETADEPSGTAAPAVASGASALVTDPVTSPLQDALTRVTAATDATRSAIDEAEANGAAQAAAAQAAAEEAARVAAEQAAQAAQRAAWKESLKGFPNGQIADGALCQLSFAPYHKLRCDAAEAFEQLNAAFAATFGTNIEVTDSYRSYGAQVACRAKKGRLCAVPGTSNHGWALAVDLGSGINSFSTAQHQWMRANAAAYQWVLPGWAQEGGSKPEPWHWEYVG